MSADDDRDRALRLMGRHLDGDLSETEHAELEAILGRSEEARRDLVSLSSLHQELFTVASQPARSRAVRRARRPASPASSRGAWIAVVAAASIFAVLALSLAVLRPGTPEVEPVAERVEPARIETARRQAEEMLESIAQDQRRVEESRKEAEGANRDRERRVAEARLALIASERQAALERLEQVRAEEQKALDEAPRPAAPKEAPAPAPTVAFLATVARSDGEAFVVSAGLRTPARPGRGILPGDGLETPKGSLSVLFGDGTRIELGPQAEIGGITEPAGKRIAIRKGRVTAEVARQPAGRPMVFATPHGEAKVVGTGLVLRVTPDATELEVKSGRVRLTRAKDGAGVDVAGGHLAEIAPGADFAPRLVRTWEFQDGAAPAPRYAGTRTTWLSQDEPTKNFAAADVLFSDGDYPEGTHRDREMLLRWDLSEIPPGLKVREAAVVVHVADGSAHPYPVYAMRRDWSETETTWREGARNRPWQAGGGQGALDRAPEIMGAVSSTDAGFAAAPLTPEGLAAVQSWIDDPRNNHGIMICNPNTSDAMGITSRRAPDPSRRPKLVVTVVARPRR